MPHMKYISKKKKYQIHSCSVNSDLLLPYEIIIKEEKFYFYYFKCHFKSELMKYLLYLINFLFIFFLFNYTLIILT